MSDVLRSDIERLLGRVEARKDRYPDLWALLTDHLPEDYDPLRAPTELSAAADGTAGDVPQDVEVPAGLTPLQAIALAAQRMSRAKKRQLLDDAMEVFMEQAMVVNEALKESRTSHALWYEDMKALIKDLHASAYMIGKSGRWADMTRSDWGRVGQVLRVQYHYLGGWVSGLYADLADTSLAMLNARAALYAAAATQSMEAGMASEIGLDPSILPAQPGDGTTECRCVLTPWSRVYTRRGYVPISEVVAGDEVLTHRLRWRRVLTVVRKEAQPHHRLVWMRAPGGEWVGMTHTHRVLTPTGWRSFNSIGNADSVYFHHPDIVNCGDGDAYENLSEMRHPSFKQEQEGSVHGVPQRLSLRDKEGLSRCRVSVLRDEPEGEGSVGQEASENAEGYSPLRTRAADPSRGRRGEYQLAGEGGRAPMDVLLGRRPAAHHLPVPVAVDHGARPDPGGHGGASHQPRLHRRSAGEPGAYDTEQAREAARGAGQAGGRGEAAAVEVQGVRQDVQGESPRGQEPPEVLQQGVLLGGPAKGAAQLDMQALREALRPASMGEQGQEAEILLSGMCRRGATIYDIEVEEDHSYILEGIVSHNTNCKCRWSVRILSKARGDYDVSWRLGNAEHCRTCRERSIKWKRLRVRGGRFAEEPEPVYAER